MNKKDRETRCREICRQFQSSGMTRKQFCEKQHIALSTLGFWLSKDRDQLHQFNPQPMVAVGSVETGAFRTMLRIRVSDTVMLELDLPAAERDIQTVIRAVSNL